MIDSVSVRVGKRAADWNDRASPSRLRPSGVRRVTSRPRKVTLPTSGRTKPEMISNNVVLPAPLGPIRPTISPGYTSRLTESTAVTPP